MEEFSPQGILVLIHRGVRFLFSKWRIILLSGLALGLFAVAIYFFKKPLYTAQFSFAFDESSVNTSTHEAPVVSEVMGYGISYEAGGVFSSMTNVMKLMQSRLIIQNTLTRSVVLDGKPVLFADFFLDSLSIRDEWIKDSAHYHFNFMNPKPTREEERYRNAMFGRMYSLIDARLLKIERLSKGTSLVLTTLTSENELFSKYFLEALIDEVSKFYIDMKTTRSKMHVAFLQKRLDSVRGAYMQSLYGRADFSDENLNPNLLRNIVPGDRKQTDVLVLRESYINLVKSIEAAKTTLMQDTPLFQYLDRPSLPLKMSKVNLLIKFIIFFLIGMVLSAGILLFRKFYLVLLSRNY